MTLHLRVTPELKKALEQRALKLSQELGVKVTLSEYVRHLINKAVKKG